MGYQRQKRADKVAEATRAKMHLQNLQAQAKQQPLPWAIFPGPFSTIPEMEAYIKGIEFCL
jgi:hypothetical protein